MFLRNTSLIQFIVNPVSGGRDNSALLRATGELLAARNERFAIFTTQAPGDARRCAAELPADTAAVVVFGGDGTLNEVADGLARRPLPILGIPCGTENLLGKLFRARRDAAWIDAALRAPRVIPFDVAAANGRHFLCVAGIGFDAEVVRRLTETRRGHISYKTYIAPVWKTFWNWSYPPLRVELDGQTVFEGRALVFIGNAPRYAFNLPIIGRAVPDDGMLDICVYPCASRRKLLWHTVITLLRRHYHSSSVLYRRARRIRIASDTAQPVEVDGDCAGTTPVDFEVHPGAARMIVAHDWVEPYAREPSGKME